MSICYQCSKELSHNEIGIYKKLINRGAEEFLCKHCLAQKLKVTPELLDEKILQFKNQGCTLFV